MLKKINLLSLTQAMNTLSDDGFKKYKEHHEIVLRESETEDLEKLVSSLNENGMEASDFENFYFGFTIPQIGKEFDILRFGANFVANIELKRTSTEEKVLKQLIRNKYYLKFTGRQVYHLTFVSEKDVIYTLKDDDTLGTIDAKTLADLLKSQVVDKGEEVHGLFNPSDYLVSPFNSTERFLKGEYFLTKQQEEVQVNILKQVEQGGQCSFISLTGGAGTGKTLLAYDIVKKVICSGHQALIFHCGQLNDGQRKLIEAGWNIAPIKNYKQYDFSKYRVVLIDEAQRIYKSQLEEISTEVTKCKLSCLFSFDKLQTLSEHEEKVDVGATIASLCTDGVYSLSEKIRSNKEIANFIRALLDKNRNFPASESKNIQVRYFNTHKDAKNFLASLKNDDYEVLRFTPSRHTNEFHTNYSDASNTNSHEVIGQEFDGVAVVIDRFFTYDDTGKLAYQGRTYYHPTKMLFQNITRARKRLLVVVLQNEELLERCVSIA